MSLTKKDNQINADLETTEGGYATRVAPSTFYVRVWMDQELWTVGEYATTLRKFQN